MLKTALDTIAKKSFRAAISGNITMIFGLALTMLGGIVGLAVDFSRASTVHGQLQSALDAAVLAAARRQSTGDEHAIESIDRFMRINFINSNPSLALRVDTAIDAAGTVTATASFSASTRRFHARREDHFRCSIWRRRRRSGAGPGQHLFHEWPQDPGFEGWCQAAGRYYL
jgi:Flp pilus assembly protein TadG